MNTVLVPLVTFACCTVIFPVLAPITIWPLINIPPVAATVTNGVAAVLSAEILKVLSDVAVSVPDASASTVAPAAEKFTPYPLPAVDEDCTINTASNSYVAFADNGIESPVTVVKTWPVVVAFDPVTLAKVYSRQEHLLSWDLSASDVSANKITSKNLII